jgi:molybdate transport system ATP-binding protein
VAQLEAGKLGKLMTRKEYDSKASALPGISYELPGSHTLQNIRPAYEHDDFSIAVKMVNTSIRYDHRTILDGINWEVRKGECWHLAGPNGSGKSTLLSLINGDNPQAFANEIYLFDRRKGSGESIWDIKRKIGYVSPELHHYFDAGSTCFDLVASGLFDTMGLFRQLHEEQKRLIGEWMQLLHIAPLAEKLFQRLSDGEQRRVLLARALVKNPPMLILDEPCQGLDDEETTFFTSLVDRICTTLGKTLIYVSHYEAEIPSCVSQKIMLEEGRIKEMLTR